MENKSLYEIDALDIVFQLLTNDETLIQEVGKESIFKHHIPKEDREKPPVIRITGYQSPTQYGDGKQLGWYCMIQVDLWHDADPHRLGMHINKLMKTINFKQVDGIPEFDPDTYLIRNGKRYEGIIIANLNELITD